MEDGSDQLERLVRVAHPVTMRQEELVTVYLCRLRLLMQYHATLLLQILIRPDIVVAREVVHLNAHIRQLRQLPQESCEPLWHYIFVFVPEVEHIAQQVDSPRLLLNRVEKPHQPPLLHPLMRNSQRPKVRI